MDPRKYRRQLNYMIKTIKVNNYCLVSDTDIIIVESKYRDSLDIPFITGHSCINGEPRTIFMTDYMPQKNGGTFLLPLSNDEYIHAKAVWNDVSLLHKFIKNICPSKYKKYMEDN